MSILVSTDPDARIVEAAMRFPGYTVERAKGGKSERWIIRYQDGSETIRGAKGKHIGASIGYGTEENAWRVVASLVDTMNKFRALA